MSSEGNKVQPDHQQGKKHAATGPIPSDAMTASSDVFWCIQTKSNVGWALLHKTMARIRKLELEMVDYRTWHSGNTVVNEVFCKDVSAFKMTREGSQDDERNHQLGLRAIVIQKAIEETIAQPGTCQVSVQEWEPTRDHFSASTPLVPNACLGSASGRRRQRLKTRSVPVGRGLFQETDRLEDPTSRDHIAQLVLSEGEAYEVRITDDGLLALHTGNAFLVRPDTSRVVPHLTGYIRGPQK